MLNITLYETIYNHWHVEMLNFLFVIKKIEDENEKFNFLPTLQGLRSLSLSLSLSSFPFYNKDWIEIIFKYQRYVKYSYH
jgi:hypothetical protein